MTTTPNNPLQPGEEYNSISASAPTTNCVHCSAPLLRDARFCLNCGFPVSTVTLNTSAVTTNCIHCNAPLVPDARFCRYCGLPVSTDAPNTSAINPPPYNQPAFPQETMPNLPHFNQPSSTGGPASVPIKDSSPRTFIHSGAWRWGMIIIGLLLAIVGSILIFTASTASTSAPAQQGTVTYKSIQGSVQSYVFISTIPASGQPQSTNYIAVDTTGNFYYFNDTDLTPALDSKSLAQGTQLTLIYRPDVTVDMNKILAPLNERVIGTGIGYKLVQITVFDSTGQNPKAYTSKEYSQYLQDKQNPGVTSAQNNQRLGIGIAGLIAGLLIALSALLVPMIVGARRKKQQTVLQVGPSPTGTEMQPEIDASSPSVETQPSESTATGANAVSGPEPQVD